jgi:hypothetical protein
MGYRSLAAIAFVQRGTVASELASRPRFALGPPNGVSLVRRRRRRIAAGVSREDWSAWSDRATSLSHSSPPPAGAGRAASRRRRPKRRSPTWRRASTGRRALCVRGHRGRDRRCRRRSTRGVGALVGERVIWACADARRGGGAGGAWPALGESACPAPRTMPRTRDRRSRAPTARRCRSRMSASS